MDAKPHRPLRSMRTFNDENLHPDGPLPKTIHHRNKSSPALSAVANAAGLKAAAKRTAFGDVSNTVGTTRSSKDDGSYLSKPTTHISTKLNVVQEKKSAAFLRPAQRPLSVSGLRHLLTGSNNNNNNLSAEVQQKPVLTDVVPVQQTANVRKLLIKRNTSIFKDATLDTVQEVDHADPQKHIILDDIPQEHQHISSDVADAQQDPQLRLPPPSNIVTTEPVKAPHELIPQLLPVLTDHVYVNDLPISSEIYQPFKQESEVSVGPSDITDLPYDDNQVVDLPRTTQPAEILINTAIKNPEPKLILPPLEQTVGAHTFVSLPPQHMQLPTHVDNDEYWEDEEDTYEEEEYVTARSFRSKGDNTTGGATTILVPRMNQRARREIEAATKLVEATRTPEEIEDECFDTSMVAEYGDEIFEYMRQLEIKMSPNPHYMDNQHEIQWSMRSVLMDWLVQVHHRFNLLPETLFLCVNYIDRFLSCKVVSLGKLQLVGATAIFIAAKYEEINCPSVQEIVYMVDGGYSIDEILKAERFMLTMLQFELGWPGPMSFLRRISKADDYDLETRTLAKYFLEVTLMDERFIGSPPSFTAAASHCLARLMLRKGSWSPHHVYYSGYTYTQLKAIVQLLLECCEDPAKHHRAVYDKYCDKRYKRASVFVQTEIQRGFRLPEPPTTKTFLHSPTYAYYNNTAYYGV